MMLQVMAEKQDKLKTRKLIYLTFTLIEGFLPHINLLLIVVCICSIMCLAHSAALSQMSNYMQRPTLDYTEKHIFLTNKTPRLYKSGCIIRYIFILRCTNENPTSTGKQKTDLNDATEKESFDPAWHSMCVMATRVHSGPADGTPALPFTFLPTAWLGSHHIVRLIKSYAFHLQCMFFVLCQLQKTHFPFSLPLTFPASI